MNQLNLAPTKNKLTKKAKDEVGRFGIDGRGYNRNTIADNDDFGFFTQNVQFEQDMIFVPSVRNIHSIS